MVVSAAGEIAEAVADYLDLELDLPLSVRRLAQASDLLETDGELLVLDIRPMSEVGWREVDEARERIPWPIVFVGDGAAIARFATNAPHLWSLVGGHVFSWAPAALDTEARLASLRAETRLEDAEVLARASAGTLPADPVFAEWLALLGRGDLA